MTTTPAEQQVEMEIPVDSFSNRLLLARFHRGLTIEQAAERCGLNYGSWSNWERGMKPRDLIDVVVKVSEGLGIDRDWLMWGGALRSRSAERAAGATGQYPAAPARTSIPTHAYAPVPERSTPAVTPGRPNSGRRTRPTSELTQTDESPVFGYQPGRTKTFRNTEATL